MTNALDTAFAAFRPEIEAQYVRHTTRSCERLLEQLGPNLKGVHNDWTWAKAFSRRLACVMTRTGGDRAAGVEVTPVVYIIDAAKMAVQASNYADAVIAAWRGKINAKIGELSAATVTRADGVSFRIAGERDGKQVTIVQQMIVNYRDHTPYNQFPALIYVDGKKVSEAAYKKLFTV